MKPERRRIEDSTPFHAGTDWIMGLLTIGAAVVVVWWFQVPLEFDFNSPSFNPAALLPVLLVAYGLIQTAKSMRARMIGRRFGLSVFEMEGERVALGQSLRGWVLTARDLVTSGGFLLRLRCIEEVLYSDLVGSRMGKKDPRDVIRWESEWTVTAQASSSEGVLVEFSIPRAAMDGVGKGRLRWTLEIEATVGGERYEALFGVPVVA
jgi:hypothetical protein